MEKNNGFTSLVISILSLILTIIFGIIPREDILKIVHVESIIIKFKEILYYLLAFTLLWIILSILILFLNKKKKIKIETTAAKVNQRQALLDSLKKRYEQKLAQKTDNRFLLPMKLRYTKNGIIETHTKLLDNETENEIYKEWIIWLNKRNHLLIVGQAGIGKSICLYKLASELLKNASKDIEKPIPVIFNLATWTEDYLPEKEDGAGFKNWLSDNLVKNYNCPQENTKELVECTKIIPILDGFDEIGYYLDDEREKNELRKKCLESIHNYGISHGNPMFVLSSRNVEYDSTGGDNIMLKEQIKIETIEDIEIMGVLDDISFISIAGKHKTSDTIVAHNLKTHIKKTPALIKVLCIPFYFNALFQVLNKKDDDNKIEFPNNETDIKNFIVKLYLERKTGKENLESLGKHLYWLVQWTKRKKKISFNLTDFDESCLNYPKAFKIANSIITFGFEMCLWVYLFLPLPIIWLIIYMLVIFMLEGGLKYKEEKEVMVNVEDIKTDSEDYWLGAWVFFLPSWIYFGLLSGFWKGLLGAIVVAVIYLLFVSIPNNILSGKPPWFWKFSFQRQRREQHSRKDELRKWYWNVLLTPKFWIHAIFEMFVAAIFMGMIFALATKLFGGSWRMGLHLGTIVGLVMAFIDSVQGDAYQIKYNESADSPIKRLLYDLVVTILVSGFTYLTLKFCIDIYMEKSIHASAISALIAGGLGMIAALLSSLIFKNFLISLILRMEGKMPFPMNTFFNDCVKYHILEYENSSWKFRHQILKDYFIEEELRKWELEQRMYYGD